MCSSDLKALKTSVAYVDLRKKVPFVCVHGVDYEKTKMRENLQSGAITLNRTRAALKACMHVFVALGRRQLLERLAAGNREAMLETHGILMLNVIEFGDTEHDPEILWLDKWGLEKSRRQFHILLACAICLVTVRQAGCAREAVKEAARVFLDGAEDAEKRLFLCRDEGLERIYANQLDTMVEDACAIVAQYAGSSDLDAFRRSLVNRLDTPNDEVHKLMRTRLRALWEKAASGTMDVAALPGAEELLDKAREWAVLVAKMADLNRRVHAPLYDRLVSEEARAALEGSTAGD